MYSKMGNDYEYKGCDLVTLNIYDDPLYAAQKVLDNGNWSYFSFDIPAGSYTNNYDYDNPTVITLELVSGIARVLGDCFRIDYLNGAVNQHSTTGIPVLGYTVKRASQAHTVEGNSEFIINEKPSVLRLRLLQFNNTESAITNIDGMVITLKFSYYCKKPSRIESAPPNRFM